MTSLLLVLLVVALLAGAGLLLNTGSRRATRVLEGPDVVEDPVASFKGGLRWPLPARLGTTNMPPTLVALEAYSWGVRVRARRGWLGAFMPSFDVRYEEIDLAEHAGRHGRLSKRSAHGVRLRSSVLGAPVIFWSSNWSFLLDALEAHGVTVVRQATPTRLWTND